MSDLEERLARSLHGRAEAARGGRTPVGDVVLRARVLRRTARRRVTVGTVAAVLVLAGGAGVARQVVSSSDGGPGPSTSTSTSTGPSTTPATLPAGPPPGISLVVDREHVAPAGAPSYDLGELPRGLGVTAVAGFDGGLLVADDRIFEGTNGLFLVTDAGVEEVPSCTSGPGAGTGDLAAWATTACPESGVPAPSTVFLREGDGTVRSQVVETADAASGQLLAVAGILDGQVVVNRIFDRGAFVTDLVGAPRVVPGVVGVGAVNETEGTLAAALASTGSGVVEPVSGEVLFAITRSRFLDDFSPDGSTVLARGALRDNRSTLWFLDAESGAERGRFTAPAGASLSQVAWESDDAVLAVLTRRSEVVVVRVGLDGSVEQAGPTYPGSARVLLVE